MNSFKFSVKTTAKTENTPIEVTCLKETKEDAYNALMHHGLDTIGKVIENWNHLTSYRGIGQTKAKNIRAAVFAWLVNENPEDSLEVLGRD